VTDSATGEPVDRAREQVEVGDDLVRVEDVLVGPAVLAQRLDVGLRTRPRAHGHLRRVVEERALARLDRCAPVVAPKRVDHLVAAAFLTEELSCECVQ
jgi:hypothetical protein